MCRWGPVVTRAFRANVLEFLSYQRDEHIAAAAFGALIEPARRDLDAVSGNLGIRAPSRQAMDLSVAVVDTSTALEQMTSRWYSLGSVLSVVHTIKICFRYSVVRRLAPRAGTLTGPASFSRSSVRFGDGA